MTKKNRKKKKVFAKKDEVKTIQNQINESYQSGVIEDELTNNHGIDSYNNKSK